ACMRHRAIRSPGVVVSDEFSHGRFDIGIGGYDVAAAPRPPPDHLYRAFVAKPGGGHGLLQCRPGKRRSHVRGRELPVGPVVLDLADCRAANAPAITITGTAF